MVEDSSKLFMLIIFTVVSFGPECFGILTTLLVKIGESIFTLSFNEALSVFVIPVIYNIRKSLLNVKCC